MPPEFISVHFITAQSGEVRQGSRHGTHRGLLVSAVAIVGRVACRASRSTVWATGWRARGGPGSVSGRLLGPQEPCRVPPQAPGRPCGPLLTSEPRPADRAGNRGQADGLPVCCPAHPQPGSRLDSRPSHRSRPRHGPWFGRRFGCRSPVLRWSWNPPDRPDWSCIPRICALTFVVRPVARAADGRWGRWSR